jgi:hypothetical protein
MRKAFYRTFKKYFDDDKFLTNRINSFLARGLPGEYKLSTELLNYFLSYSI